IRVTATVDDKDVAFTGRFNLKLAYTAQEDVLKAYALTIVVADGSRTLVTLRAAPPTPTSSWKKGRAASQEIDVPFPTDADGGAAPALSAQEEAVVAERIADERTRYLRQEAGRFFDKREWHAALRVLEAIGGTLAEQADKAVLGAVKEARRVEKDAQDVRERL